MREDRASRQDPVRRPRRRGFWRIGIFLLLAVTVYLLIAFSTYLIRRHTASYEVVEGTIVEDSIYTGVIVRQEEDVKSPRAGYLNYYLDDKSKAGLGQTVCAVSGESLNDQPADEEQEQTELTAAQRAAVLSALQEYVSSADDTSYSMVYDLREEMASASGAGSAGYQAEQIDRRAEAGEDIDLIDAPRDGLIVYAADSLDGLKAKDVTEKTFDQKDYEERGIKRNTKLAKGDPLFKVITDEHWSLLFPLDDELEKRLADTTTIETKIGNKSSSLWGDFEIVHHKRDSFGQLSYSSDMMRFASQRFVTVELIFRNNEGLKIPRSAVTKKKAYEIPEEFVITDPATARTGVEVVGEDGSRVFTAFDVLSHKDGCYYAKTDAFEKGSVIGKDNDPKTFKLKKTRAFKGVYNINKGYAAFQAVDVIASNEAYYIINEQDIYGPALYDQIALNASRMSENKVVQTPR